MTFHEQILRIDSREEVRRISEFIAEQRRSMRRDGAVIGLSGGIDSAVSSALCVKAIGKENVLGLILPERDSNPISVEYALEHAQKMGIKTEIIDITPALQGFGTYEKRDQVIREIFPEYDSPTHKMKIALPPDLLGRDSFNFFTLTISDGQGEAKTRRLKRESLSAIVAATNTKQRTRMMHLYYAAEKTNYFVCGTTNKSENIQGFFVKYGDGGVDIEPIAHLYKTQVYQLAEHLGVPENIINRYPSPDTFSFSVSDEEFYFRMPYDKLDMLLFAWEKKIPAEIISQVMGLSGDQIQRAFRDFSAKYHSTEHLRVYPPSLTQ
jgi:NAD+ synthase